MKPLPLPHHPAEPFFKGREFGMPTSTFILIALPSHEHRKLEEWQARGDRIQIQTASHGEVFLMNETRFEAWENRKAAREARRRAQK